jgi:hypothetical protein
MEWLLAGSPVMRPDRPLVSLIRSVTLSLAAMAVCPADSLAQADEVADDIDTLYVKDLSDLLTLRYFNSTKYNEFRIGSRDGVRDHLEYRPTNQYNFGIGASYRKFTLNLGVGIPFFTRDRRETLGHSRYLDAQAHFLSAERATNLFLQFFKGYRLTSHPMAQLGWNGTEGNEDSAFRDDIEQFNFGVSTLRVFNSRRFSYRATVFQDAWQRRSQGSWLGGAYFGYYRLRADSSLVPAALEHLFAPEASIRRGDLFDIGPMGGYAYTLVINEGFFIMGSLAVGAGLSMQYRDSDPRNNGTHDHSGTTWGPGWRVQFRGGIGYNSRRTQVGINFNHEQINYLMPMQSMFSWGVGNVRFNIVQRLDERVVLVDRILKFLKPRTHPIIHEIVPALKEAEIEN